MSNKSTKCRCGQNQTKGFCKNCSRMKMVVLFKTGFKESYGNKNLVRYNFTKTNRHPDEKIFTDMVNRIIIKGHIMQQAIGAIHFYDNHTNQLIQEFK